MSSKATYVDLRNNGRLFPLWILKNFKQYKLPDIILKENDDPCNPKEVKAKVELRKYQAFIGSYLHPRTPYRDILLYHGMGSGKTATSINLLNILYNHDPTVDFIILIKASLRDDPWMMDLKKFIDNPNGVPLDKNPIYSNIHFIHYDSPFADKAFMEKIKTLDSNRKRFYIIDEVHNFIRNVYSNITSKSGKRASVIYEYISREKREMPETRIMLISATPGVTQPFEFSLIFNLLRPNIFPTNEQEFNSIFVSGTNYPILNPQKRNLFMRRIMGLVSYYVGATPEYYASRELHYVSLPMTSYQYEIYREFEKKELAIELKAKRFRGKGKKSKLYKTYTRQACNFVFPDVDTEVHGDTRPRPYQFELDDAAADHLEKGKLVEGEELKTSAQRYVETIHRFIDKTQKYFDQIHKKDKDKNITIFDDLEKFKKGFEKSYEKKFEKFYQSGDWKSELFKKLYECSPKALAVAFYVYLSPGKVMIYTNYVIMEGIDILRIYFHMIGYKPYLDAEQGNGYCEYHGRIDPEERKNIKKMFNDSNNIKGEKCKVIFVSPSATEGIQLLNIRQEHIFEPHWTETRIQQVMGRGIRQCSHKELPITERHVEIYRYVVTKPLEKDKTDEIPYTTDQYISDKSLADYNLIESFLVALKEVAVDCELFKAHNMLGQSYSCFKFPDDTLLAKHIGPAYKEDIKDDLSYDSGLHAINTRVVKIKVVKIKAVYKTGGELGSETYSSPIDYWYHDDSRMVYDLDTHYPVGRVGIYNNMPEKLDKDTYIISDMITIPTLN